MTLLAIPAAACPTDGFATPDQCLTGTKPRTPVDSLLPFAGVRHHLQKDGFLVVPHPLGRDLRCVVGTLWITHDGDPKDIVLEAEETYRVDRPARMVIHALEPAEFLLAR
ncbi:MAG: DUF2917 domain-containing protein [Proteobacteria bacterium]|nr:DUF2917 domain-containing protein [Pseudomonadota bacterium]